MNAQSIYFALNILSKDINLAQVQVSCGEKDVTFTFLTGIGFELMEVIYQNLLCAFYERDIATSSNENGRFTICISGNYVLECT